MLWYLGAQTVGAIICTVLLEKSRVGLFSALMDAIFDALLLWTVLIILLMLVGQDSLPFELFAMSSGCGLALQLHEDLQIIESDREEVSPDD